MPSSASLEDRIAALEARLAGPSAPVLDSLLTIPMLAERIKQTERTLSEWRIRGDGPPTSASAAPFATARKRSTNGSSRANSPAPRRRPTDEPRLPRDRSQLRRCRQYR